jgi:DUF1009 family protein
MSDASKRDFEIGREIVARLAPFDVGQAVVVANGTVLAIEGAEGTDAMLRRVAERRDGARGGVLVKWPKPGQELRVDMPAIGPNTIAGVVAAGLQGIAVQAGATLAAQRGDTMDAADAAQVFIAGLEAGAASGLTQTALRDDGEIGLAVLGALVPRVRSLGVVVVRRHVLAVEAGEGLGDLVARAAGRRQWGKSKKRRGALAVASLSDFDRAVITAAADAGYQWIVASAGDGAAGLADDVRSVGMKLSIGGTEV